MVFCFSSSISYAAECILDVPLYEGPDKVMDRSPAKRKVMIVGKYQWIKSGSASFVELDGETGCVLIHPDNLKPQDFAMSFWLKPYSGGKPSQCVIKGAWGGGNYHGFAIIMEQRGDLNRVILCINFGDKSPRTFSFGVIPTDKFTHLAFNYDHENVSLFINGEKTASIEENRDINYSETSSQLRLGKGYGKRFKGIIAGLKMFAKGTDDKFMSSLAEENKQLFEDRPLKKQATDDFTKLYYTADNRLGPDLNLSPNPALQKTLLIDYRFNSGQGLKIKDYSPFHNDAEVMGPEWDDVAQWQKDNGLIISSVGAHIPGSSAITPEKFSLHLNIKPLKMKYAEIFRLYVTPFYLKDRTLTWKNKEKLYYPVYYIFNTELIKNNNIRVRMNLKGTDGNLIRRSFVSKKGLPSNEFSKVIITFNGENLIISINGQQEFFAAKGQLYYDHPQLYSGHVNAYLGGGSIAEYKDLKFYSLDNLNERNPKYAIKIKTPYYLNFFAQDEQKTIDLGISSFYDAVHECDVFVKSTDHEEKEVFQSRFKAKLKPLRENIFKIVIPQDIRGCFWLDCSLTDERGNVIKRTMQYSVGAIRSCEDFPDSSPFGNCTELYAGQRQADFGEKWTRISVMWYHLEPKNNEFDFSKLDKSINYNYNRRKRNISLCFSAGAPRWLTKSKIRGACIDPNNEDHFKYYERMVRKVLTRYKGKINDYDPIGEANAVPAFRNSSPQFYLRVMKIFHKVKQECDPTSLISGPSAWRGGWDQPTERFLKVGAGKYWDRLNIHYIGGAGAFYFIPEDSVPGTIKGSREMMRKYNINLPIIDGETGYVVSHRRAKDSRPRTISQLQRAISREELYINRSLWTAHSTRYIKSCKDEITGAQFTVRRMILCLSEGVNLHLRHEVGTMIYNSEVHPRFGKNHCTGVLLPGIAWVTMIDKLSWAKFVRKIDLADEKMYAYLFYDMKDKKYLAVLWSYDKKRSVLINPDCINPGIYNIWGNPQKCNFVKKNLLLELSESPIYVENVGKDIAEAEVLFNISVAKTILPQEPCRMKIELNNSQAKSITWTLDINAEKDVKLDKKHFTVELNPGEKKIISTVFTPDENKKGKINIEIKLTSTEYGEIIKNVSTLIKKRPSPVIKTSNKIVIDGDDSDWPENAQKIFLGKQDQVKYGLNCLDPAHRNPDRDWVGEEDLSGSFQLCWDSENIYVLAEITDPERNVLRSGNRIRACDGFELFWDGRDSNEQGKDPYDILKGVRHFFVSPGTEDSQKALIRIKGPEGEKFAGLIKSVSKETDKGYVVELKIPILEEFFPQLQLKKGRVIGFNIYLSDADKLPRAKSTIVWHGNVESNKKPSDFGQIILTEQE